MDDKQTVERIDNEIAGIDALITERITAVYEDISAITDKYIQKLANRFKLRIDTNKGTFCRKEDGSYLAGESPIFHSINNLRKLLVKHFGEIFEPKIYEPMYVKNSSIGRCVIMKSQNGEWESMYIDGFCVMQGHEIDREDFFFTCMKYGITTDDYASFEVSDEDENSLIERGMFPENLEEFVTEYGVVPEKDLPEKDLHEKDAEEVDYTPKTCQFEKGWIGKCTKPAIPGTNFCGEHHNLKCASCGKQATHDCDQTMGPFVCGRLLCDSCHCLH